MASGAQARLGPLELRVTRLQLRRMLQRQLARRARRPWIIVRGTIDGLDYMDEYPSVWHRPDLGELLKVLRRADR